MTWQEIDWSILDRLRDGFLASRAVEEPYWQAPADLANYDFTFGERIGWKWDAVLNELLLRGWAPPPGIVVDWGCGSGVAGRRVVAAFNAPFTALRLHDHSPLAQDFAIRAARAAFPDLKVGAFNPDEPIGLLVVSHVLNELQPDGREALLTLMRRAAAVIWVEPGTHAVSRDLVTWRESLLPQHQVIAPCTHSLPCGLLVAGRERDWCHHFAPPPKGIQADSDWVRFGQRAGVDLRSLPYAFLVLEQTGLRDRQSELPPGSSRILGRPEHFKPYARLLNCDGRGLMELTVPKRSLPALYKQLERNKGPLLYRWQHDESGAVSSGEPVVPRPAAAPDSTQS